MKKLLVTTVAVAIAFLGFIAVLCFLPSKNNCCHDRNQCEMNDGDGKCSSDKNGCDGNEKCNVKVWTDADGKTHKEVIVIKGDDDGMCGNKMDGGCSGNMNGCPMNNGKCGPDSYQAGDGMDDKCKMDSMMGGKCNMDKMQMGCGMNMRGCCCCCCMMMNGMHCNMNDDNKGENKSDSVHVKIRGKL